MIYAIVFEGVAIVLFIVICWFAFKEISKQKKEIAELEKENLEYLRKMNELTEIRQETIENQKKYRTVNDDDSFNASLEFLHNHAKNGNTDT